MAHDMFLDTCRRQLAAERPGKIKNASAVSDKTFIIIIPFSGKLSRLYIVLPVVYIVVFIEKKKLK